MLALAASLAGCADTMPPLPTGHTLVGSVADLRVDRSQLPFPELAEHPFAADGALDLDDIATLAVLNNPDLKVARADAGVTHAQAFAAGLLPDPQLQLTRDFPDRQEAGTTNAFNLNLSEDLNALLRHPHDKRAAELDARKTDLNLLWQEWQVVAKARTLGVKLVQEQRLQRVLQENRRLFADRYQRTEQALERRLLAIDAVTPHLTALQDVDKQLRDLERQVNTDAHDLNALLGLLPDTPVPLRAQLAVPDIDESAVLALLPDLPARRPDLIALQAGYQAEDQRVRAALASRFPTFNVGFTRARDTSGVYTHGFGVTLSLPLFNGNRGNIAIEEATREKLRRDYESRLDTMQSDVHRILSEQRINARQLREVKEGIASLSTAAADADAAFRARAIDALAYVTLRASLLSKQVEEINLEQSILEQRVALQALIGPTTAIPALK
ncbi:MAG: transporter [Ramlibacter sp.]|nr:transporter [Ramlibacter sp.]